MQFYGVENSSNNFKSKYSAALLWLPRVSLIYESAKSHNFSTVAADCVREWCTKAFFVDCETSFFGLSTHSNVLVLMNNVN